jgi:glutathione synthase/RimK-type ligase-like ATP-grasp enzyme
MRVAILRCQDLPKFITWEVPDLDELFEEDRLVISAFEDQGVEASSIIWRDASIEWGQFDVALIRSTWDYIDYIEPFLTVLSEIENSSCKLFNSEEAVRWNSDKHYLLDLERWDVPILPTYLASNSDSRALQKEFAKRNWRTAILKPTVGVGGADTYRVASTDLSSTLRELKLRHPRNEYLIQPFAESVVTDGEWSFVYFNRELSHVLLKKPAADDYRTHGLYGGTIEKAVPPEEYSEQADAILAKIPFDLLYVRLDLIIVDGRLAVVEVELIEPILYFRLVPDSIRRLVSATMERL